MSQKFERVLRLMTEKLILDKTEISDTAKPYVDAINMAKKEAHLEKTAEKKAKIEAQKDSTVNLTMNATLETVQKVHAGIIKRVKTKKFLKLTHVATCSLGVAFDMYSANRGVNVYGLYDVAKIIHPEIGNAIQAVYNPLQHLVKGYVYEFALNIVDKKVNRELARLKAHGHIEDYSHIIEAYQKAHTATPLVMTENSLTAISDTKKHEKINQNNETSLETTQLDKTNSSISTNKVTHLANKIYFVRAKKLEMEQSQKNQKNKTAPSI